MRIATDVVREGDTVVSLAARLLGDPRRWQELVTTNRLVPPYVADVGTTLTGVLVPGGEVLYVTGDAPARATDPSVIERRTYFVDLDLDQATRDVRFERGRLVFLAGLPNLKEAVLRRVRTAINTHPFHPGYGNRSRLNVGAVADNALLSLIASDTRAAIVRDPRVEDAVVTLEWEFDTVRMEAVVTPVPPGTPFTLRDLLRAT